MITAPAQTNTPGNTGMFKAKILVVEDDIHLLAGIRDILELEAYSVLTAQNGRQALEVLRSDPNGTPDLIVSDIMMPYLDGFQFLEEVRKEDRWVTVPFIFLTAKGEKADMNKGKQLGVDDYLTKPFDADDLLVAVASRLKRHKRITDVQAKGVEGIKRDILTILNHEFRTPLTLVVAYAEMLKDYNTAEMGEADLMTFLHGVNSGAERLKRLIENFILLVELESGDVVKNYAWRKRPIDKLEPLIANAQRQIFSGENSRHTCEVELAGGLPTVIIEPELLAMAVRELLDNAVKFSQERTKERAVRVKLGVRSDDQHLYIWVQDWGRGVAENELENIWKPFYQINRDEYEDQGAGSGLAIVKGVVDIHLGRTEVVSEVGAGSTFTLVIPLQPPATVQ
jgi:two-component system, sensor histidine kinase and response regulator